MALASARRGTPAPPPSGSARVELFIRTKKTGSPLLVLAHTGDGEAATGFELLPSFGRPALHGPCH
jgi:hypothetical protein